MMEDEGDEPTYRENYQRLAEVKARHDPENFFRVNQNTRSEPAPAAFSHL